MGKKHGDKKKKATKITLSLGEFNSEAGLGGADPELSALPSAPKAAEEWDAEGGRPEYNSRGYKERQVRTYDNDAEFDDRDWTRKGPLDAPEGNGFGTGPERDWGDMRRGPVDNDGGVGGTGTEQADRNWNEMRRGPVESQFEASANRDWSMRKGPVEAEMGSAPRVIDDDSWGTRKGPIEAEFQNATSADRNWSVRKGPVEADLRAPAQEADWSAPRKGPVESEFGGVDGDSGVRDWTQRKGPVEANPAPGKQVEADWSDVRKGPVEAEAAKPVVEERDWSSRRGPVETDLETVQKAVRDVDFGEMRRGARLQELKVVEEAKAKAKVADPPTVRPDVEKDTWRRDNTATMTRRGLTEGRAVERPASTGHDSAPAKERDWGAARRTHGVRANTRQNRPNTFRSSESTEPSTKTAAEEQAGVAAQSTLRSVGDDDWTTVRSAGPKRASMPTRRQNGKEARGGFQRRTDQGLLDSTVNKPIRSLNTEKKASTSPVTPVPSAVSES